jgi:hypothetical protein
VHYFGLVAQYAACVKSDETPPVMDKMKNQMGPKLAKIPM